MKLKSTIISALAVGFLLITQTAHADFRKALDAYQKRDGGTMLKEVKDAVDKKNDDDGLMLLLMATNMDATTSDYDETTKQSKSTLRAILPQPKWDEMRELLVQATNNSTVDAQYYLLTRTIFQEEFLQKYILINKLSNVDQLKLLAKARSLIKAEYIKKGSRMARLESDDIFVRAEEGDPLSQLQLGLKYMGAVGENGCNSIQDVVLCKAKDETKGYEWLKRAAKSYEVNTEADFDLFTSEMCKLLSNSLDLAQQEQAYLWGMFGASQHTRISRSQSCIRDKLSSKNIHSTKKLPEWISELRRKVLTSNLPVFSYYFSDNSLPLTIYEDGRVYIYVQETKSEILWQRVSPKKVEKFMKKLTESGFYQWTLENTEPAICDQRHCPVTQMKIISRSSKNSRSLFLQELYYKELAETDFLKYKMSQYEIELYKKIMATRKKSKVNLAFAKIKALVDENFPTQKFRCGLIESSEKKLQCFERDAFWTKLEKEGN